jgi:hypothetical protein
MNNTSIQWAHSTVNPIMGCLGCELFPKPEAVLTAIDEAIGGLVPGWKPGDAKVAVRPLIDRAYAAIDSPAEGHSRAVTTTNIVHVANQLAGELGARHGAPVGVALREAVDRQIVCYASKLHLNRATSIVSPSEHKGNGALFTLTYEGRLFILLGVATDEESSRSVWDWLSNQYQVLRTASYRMKISPKPSDLKLRRSRTLGSNYDCCDVPNKPGNWPWFSYLINDNHYFDLMCYFPSEAGALLAPLSNQWCKRVQQKGLKKLLASRAKTAVSQEI